MDGFFKQALRIDVGQRSSQVETLEDAYLRATMGGKGLGTQLLLDNNPPGVDPFSPESCLIVALGPATDSPIHGSCRHGIYAKSPLTGLYTESYAGGSAAIAMSRAGYDAYIFHGAADHPLWVEITDQGVSGRRKLRPLCSG
ncbi:MAG: aldehyde ferredoxin oxidoreductase N-terminal domain-containing protein [Desulfobacteraceae bacterium]